MTIAITIAAYANFFFLGLVVGIGIKRASAFLHGSNNACNCCHSSKKNNPKDAPIRGVERDDLSK